MTDEEKRECGEPCPYDQACEECRDYWERMIHEAFWQPEAGWTDKAFKQWVK